MTNTKTIMGSGGDAQRGQKKPFKFRDAYRLQGILAQEKPLHYCCLFMVAVDSMLRCSDVIKLKVSNVRYASGRMRTELALKQKKNQNNVYPVLSPQTQAVCQRWIAQSGKVQSDYLFTGLRSHKRTPIYHTTYRYHAKKWARKLGLDEEDYSTHSMRRIKPHYLYYQCGVSIDEICELMGHQDTKTTRIYLGIDKRKAQQSALKYNLFSKQAQKRKPDFVSQKDTTVENSQLKNQIKQLNQTVQQLSQTVDRMHRSIKELTPLVEITPQLKALINHQNSLWTTHD